MSEILLPDGSPAKRQLDRAETEALLLSLLARESAPKTFDTATEQQLWYGQRIGLAESVLRLVLDMGPQAISILPLGSVVPIQLRGRTKNRGPKLEIVIPEEVEIRLREEDPADRDLLLLVQVDNAALKAGKSPIVRP